MQHQQLRIVADGSCQEGYAVSATIIETFDMSMRIIIPSPVTSNKKKRLLVNPYHLLCHVLVFVETIG